SIAGGATVADESVDSGVSRTDQSIAGGATVADESVDSGATVADESVNSGRIEPYAAPYSRCSQPRTIAFHRFWPCDTGCSSYETCRSRKCGACGATATYANARSCCVGGCGFATAAS
ncbi:MAG: hypothetical protein KBG15_16085, partial [Kofleriaceae bacterium]|nr:hypothetical protein [Kofleriaceae bacterium]